MFTAAGLAGLSRTTFDSSLASLTLADDPVRLFNEEIREQFGDEEIGVVALVVPDLWTPESIRAVVDLTEKLAAVPEVTRTLSIANAADPVADVFDPQPLLAPGPITAASVARLRERVGANPIYTPNLVAADGSAAAITVFFRHAASPADEVPTDDGVAAVLAAYDGPGELHYTGMSHIRVQAVRLMQSDLARFLPLSLLVMMVVLWLLFRSPLATVLPLLSVAIGVGSVMGLMGWVGAPITLTTLVLPSLLLVIGGSYSVHVVAAWLETARGAGAEAEPREHFQRTLSLVGLPVVVSALTTGVGFGALAIHPIPAIAVLGKYAVLGIAIVAAGSLIGLPLIFLSLPRRASRASSSTVEPDAAPGAPGVGAAGTVTVRERGLLPRLDRLIVTAGAWCIDHRRTVFVLNVLLVVVSVAGAVRVRADTDFLKAFRPGSEVREDHRVISEKLVGPSPINVIVTAAEPGYFRRIAPLRRIRDFQEFVETLDGVEESISMLDYLEELDLGLRADDGGMVVDDAGELVEAEPPPSFWDAPEEQLPQVFQLVAASPRTFAGLVDADFRRLNITLRTSISGSAEVERVVQEVHEYSQVIFPRGVVVDATGGLVVMSSASSRIISGQVESLGLAFIVIFAVLSVMFLSMRVAFAAMVPNVIPVVVFFGVMGWTGVELNLATSIIGAVALGIAVDDTIHYMARLNSMVKIAPSQRDALLLTLEAMGRPAVATSVTLMAGFAVMCVSGFGILNSFGFLAALVMITALLCDLLLLPAILATVPVVSVWDLVYYKLGQSPHLTIPLFKGLGQFAVRLIVLLGRIRVYEQGEYLARYREPGTEMYLILEGDAEIRLENNSGVIPLSRGGIVGEMALLRHSPRAADVVAVTRTEVLVIDEDFLRRLRIRYPRFASRFFLNIASILSDRLEATNARLRERG